MFYAKKNKKVLEYSETFCKFATAFQALRKSLNALVKSSLVFLLVEGCQLAALRFLR
jgi:hypothetical protein